MEDTAWWRDPRLGERRELTLAHTRLHVFESGQGEPVVFVHGLLVNANLWRAVVPLLSDRARCLTLDLPLGSHALSAPDADLSPAGLASLVGDAIQALGVGPVTLVGNDTGGAICQLLAVARPELVARLVLTSCDAYDNFLPKAFAPLQAAARVPAVITLLLNALRAVPPLRRLPLAYGWLSVRPVPRNVSDSYVLPGALGRDIRDDLRRVLKGVHRRHTLEAARHFGDFTHPVLLAWSEHDRFFPAAYAERLAADFPNARITWIPRARTFSPEDQPERLATAIADFLSTHDPVREPTPQVAEVPRDA